MSNSSVGDTITNGIQDISALLPLLGTEQCEEHTGSALGKGYLYTSITPISIFGSLGVVKAGFNVLVAATTMTFPCWKFVGAQWLDNGGFKPLGDHAQLIAFDPQHRGRFLAESNLEKILERLHNDHIDNGMLKDLEIDWAAGSLWWNIKMAGLTLGFSALGIAPYLYIILRSTTTNQNPLFLSGWGFPAARLIGSSITGIIIQIIIQIRILTILKNRLIFLAIDQDIKLGYYGGLDQNQINEIRQYLPESFDPNRIQTSETCLWDLGEFLKKSLSTTPRNAKTVLPLTNVNPTSPLNSLAKLQRDLERIQKKHLDTKLQHLHLAVVFNSRWMIGINIFLRILLAIALIISIAGYVGCFNLIQRVPQNARAGPVLWLVFEAVLCLTRIIVWASNPNFDDNEGVTFTIPLKAGSMDPTCVDISVEACEHRQISVVPSQTFLKDVARHVGPVPEFQWSDTDTRLKLYYILTNSQGHDTDSSKLLYLVVLPSPTTGCLAFLIVRKPNEKFSLFECALTNDSGGDATVVVRQQLRVTEDSDQWRCLTDRNDQISALVTNTGFMASLFAYYDHISESLVRLPSKKFIEIEYPWNLKPKEVNPDAIRLDRKVEQQVKSLGQLPRR